MKKTRTLEGDPGDHQGCKYYGTTSVKDILDPWVTWYRAGGIISEYYRKRLIAQNQSTLPSLLGYESIESTTRPKPLYNACYHTKRHGFNYAYAACLLRDATRVGIETYYRRATSASSVGELTPMSWSVFDGAQRRAWWSMQPRFEGEVQLLNFIYEMKDFKSIFKTLMHFRFDDATKTLLNLRRKIARQLNHDMFTMKQSGATLRDITRTVAEARLVYSFAIMPLLSDIASLFKTLAVTIAELQDRFVSRGTLHQVSHYSEPGDEVRSGRYGVNNADMFYVGRVSSSKFTSTLQYSYRYDMRKGWKLLERGLGLEVNAEVLWNALPFSFLVDYFYKIGQAIHSMKTDPNVHVRTLQYCESILQTTISGYMLDTSSSRVLKYYAPCAEASAGSLLGLSGYSATLFQRRLVPPNKGAALPRASGPSKGQMWNIAALIRCFLD